MIKSIKKNDCTLSYSKRTTQRLFAACLLTHPIEMRRELWLSCFENQQIHGDTCFCEGFHAKRLRCQRSLLSYSRGSFTCVIAPSRGNSAS